MGKVRADGARGRFFRVGRANQGAEIRHSVVFLEDGRHDGCRGHVLGELPEKGTVLVDSVKRGGIVHAELRPLHRFDGETSTDDAVDDFASVARACCVGLDHGESAVGRHGEKIDFLSFGVQKYIACHGSRPSEAKSRIIFVA